MVVVSYFLCTNLCFAGHKLLLGQLCYGLYVPRRGGMQVTGLVVDGVLYITGRHGTVSKLSTNSQTFVDVF